MTQQSILEHKLRAHFPELISTLGPRLAEPHGRNSHLVTLAATNRAHSPRSTKTPAQDFIKHWHLD